MDYRGIAEDFIEQVRTDDALGLAAELAYRFLFALFPFGIFVAALAAFVASWFGTDPSGAILRGLGDNLPRDVASSIRPELTRILGSTRPGLLSVGALGAVWAATSGTLALIKTMNRAYDVQETRPTWVRYGTAIGLTVIGGAAIVASFVTLVGGALLTTALTDRAGVSEGASAGLTLLRWPLVFAMLVGAVAVLVRIAPNARPPWRMALAGGAIFAVGWIVATWLFALYVGNFGGYDATYGALAGFAVLMLWFYITALVLIASAELTGVLTKRLAPAILVERREATQAELAVSRAARDATETARDKIDDAAATVEDATGERRGEDVTPSRGAGWGHRLAPRERGDDAAGDAA
ncbi:MAG TPA: YihY/virulence factor BrkB family protein [Candidatus Limnocylindrales bacterium]|nr:YihY/virulence factor BrkB family protein [Candidatus Limnocylindrales bacterium]